MKKQTKHSIKAHLLWSALILLSLLAVCAIPFALAQRQATKRSVAKPDVAAANISGTDQSQIPKFPYSSARTREPQVRPAGQSELPTKTSQPGLVGPMSIPPVPKLPAVTLYDQLNNPGTVSTGSQDFEAANNAFDTFTADDFVVPGGQTWNITEVDVAGEYSTGGPADSFHVFFYADSGTLPGAVTLTAGTYWVAVQARQDFGTAGQWFWDNRLIISNSGAAWQNPGGGFGVGCLTYGRKTTCLPTQNGPDQLFRLV